MVGATVRIAGRAIGALTAGVLAAGVSAAVLAAGGCAARSAPSTSPPVSGTPTAAPSAAAAATASPVVSRPASAAADVLRRFGVPLPSCPTRNLRYAVTDALYLRFDADQACVDEYLRGLGIAELAGAPPVQPSFGTAECRAYGWCLDPARSYQYYSAFTAPRVEAELFVDTSRSPQTVYLRAAVGR